MIPFEERLNLIVNATIDIADAAEQERIWLNNPEPWQGFDELFQVLHGDSLSDRFFEEFGSKVGPTVLSRWSEFKQAVDSYYDQGARHLSLAEVLKDPEWHRVRGLANAFLESVYEIRKNNGV